MTGVSIIIPTLNGGTRFLKCLNQIRAQKYSGKVELIIVDSGSNDGTCEAAESFGAIVKRIDKKEFNHSKTRTEAVAIASQEKIILMVQDAVPVDENWLLTISQVMDSDKSIVAAYGRQIPHTDADLYAMFEVEHHSEYLGSAPKIQTMDSKESFARKSYEEALANIRLDNVCAIYQADVLRKIAFPEVSFAEDMAWAYLVLSKGYKILYHPDIVVRHSHNRRPEYRFRRAVANSIACMQILGRVKYNLASYTPHEYGEISAKVSKLIQQIREEISNLPENTTTAAAMDRKTTWMAGQRVRGALRGKANPIAIVRNVFKKIILLGIFDAIIIKVAPKYKIKLSETAFELHMKYVIKTISAKYPDASKDALKDCVDQVAFSILGNFLGEIYASYRLSGKSSNELDSIITPFLGGV